ncbi:hypothetical protein Pan153_46670 [Gimesia panareensis]|uniref:Uncharacterized protein n=1 Tax=Gimesia panareensis TaxID=2527978 RepID=A0A518ABE3_9PLAN|nr:hypothetical protein Enr10x_45480 [Gimesia panareensis]QDU52051.1 hypothetical protein Pan110_44210 [Gimesia panareensis]QDV19998.1 hypothetical protein Pan153_46670 [Gimesia panareensis]
MVKRHYEAELVCVQYFVLNAFVSVNPQFFNCR